MCNRIHLKLTIAVFFVGALAFAASQAKAAADFTLGRSTLTVGIEGDPTVDGGCMNGTSNDGCDSYKFKVPISVDPNNDIGNDLQIPSDELAIGISSTQFCGGGTVDLQVNIPHSSLIVKRTKGEDTVRFNGMAEAFTPSTSAIVMVPVKLLIQVHRHTGKGFFMVSGLGDLTPLNGNATGFVGLAATVGDGDGDTDLVCTLVTQKNKNQK